MIKKVRIAVDHGNRNMKTCSRVFTTGLTIQDKKPARREKFLFYEGKYYVLSENRIPYQRDKTHDDRFFILTLFAIVKELEENPQIQPEDVIQVDLPIGLPPKEELYECEDCSGCPYAEKCKKTAKNRTVRINQELTAMHQEVIENLESIHGALLRMNRSIQAEGTFGIMKNDRWYKRIVRRGINSVKLEVLLVAIGHNLYKYQNKKMRNRTAA